MSKIVIVYSCFTHANAIIRNKEKVVIDMIYSLRLLNIDVLKKEKGSRIMIGL